MRLRGRDDFGAPAQQRFHPLQAYLAGLEGVEREAQQRRGEHQPLDIENQRHQTTDRQASGFDLAAAEGDQNQQADRRDSLQQREQGAAGATKGQSRIAKGAVAHLEGFQFGALLAVNLDRANAGKILLD